MDTMASAKNGSEVITSVIQPFLNPKFLPLFLQLYSKFPYQPTDRTPNELDNSYINFYPTFLYDPTSYH